MTTSATTCLLLTCDFKLTQRLIMAAGGLTDIRATSNRMEWTCKQRTPTVLLLDLRHPEAEAALSESTQEARSGIVTFGVPESDPFLACHEAGVFAVEPLDIPAERLRRTLRQTILLHQAQEELSVLRQQRGTCTAEPLPQADEPGLNLAPLYELWRASRHFNDIYKLLNQLVEGVATAGRFARVGVFACLHDEANYRLWAGLRCMDNADSLSFEPSDRFVRWLELHAHLVCRAHLVHVDDFRERRMLQNVLDEAGAEIIVPLLGKRGLFGWIFVGHRSTGIPFASRDLIDLTFIGEQVATLLENALLVEELAVQKTLAENLLEAIPIGILAVSEDGVVRWFNHAAEQILDASAAESINRPVKQSGSQIADMILRTIHDGAAPAPTTWTDSANRRTIRAESHRIGNKGTSLGAMLLLSDISHERLLKEEREELERHTFWNDLAAAMSHEIRNPLVAISTFAQLLPERHTDPEFRLQFFDIVTSEVERLNSIITQINTFAHPPKLVFHPITPGELIAQACVCAKQLAGADKNMVTCKIQKNLPTLTADTDALTDGIAHVLVNAYEAVHDRPSPRICLHVRCAGIDDCNTLVCAISDNGAGIAEDMRDKLFSPFSTTKMCGLGLGLPLARRAVVDHGGRIDVDTTEKGTTVTITLPLKGGPHHAETLDC